MTKRAYVDCARSSVNERVPDVSTSVNLRPGSVASGTLAVAEASFPGTGTAPGIWGRRVAESLGDPPGDAAGVPVGVDPRMRPESFGDHWNMAAGPFTREPVGSSRIRPK